jgi:NAD(P)-dependent dehydrogenase (short-subunit alcohol dehydrogenase family)
MVTAAASGIGLATAKLFAEGCSVMPGTGLAPRRSGLTMPEVTTSPPWLTAPEIVAS